MRATFARCLVGNLLLVGLVACGVVAIEANTEQARMPLPDGISECWNGATAQITTVVGECP